MPPGSTPPGSTTTTRSPTAKFSAPQTMPCGSPVPLAAPTSTVHQRITLPFFCGSSSIVRTRPRERLELEPERGQPGGQVLGGQVVGKVDVVPDPGNRGAHVVSDLRSE